MKYSISESARIAGITRKTFYKHIDKKGISVEKDQDNNPLIDASELIRVYGDQCSFELDTKQQETVPVVTPSTEINTSKDVEIATLKERVKNLEEQREHFEKLYQEERLERQETKKLLTDGREKQEQWQKAFADLQTQVITSQQTTKEEMEEFKTLTKKRIIAYKRALEAEKNKPLWQRLFVGKRKV